jgi:KDEL-tailed cysteine endopeptidase
MDYAFAYTKVSGIPTESSYPYKGVDGTCKKFTSVFKNGGYSDVTSNSESALVAAIAK